MKKMKRLVAVLLAGVMVPGNAHRVRLWFVYADK